MPVSLNWRSLATASISRNCPAKALTKAGQHLPLWPFLGGVTGDVVSIGKGKLADMLQMIQEGLMPTFSQRNLQTSPDTWFGKACV